MKFVYFFFFLFSFSKLTSQVVVDSINDAYLEDQIYVTMMYNIIKNKPADVTQNGFSGGLSLGFIKDIPINKTRTIGFGLGLGYSYNVVISNLQIVEDISKNNSFSLVDDYTYNRLKSHAIEMPIEFRWRNSSSTKYKFWRIYGGVTFTYNFMNKSEFKNDLITVTVKDIDSYNKFQSNVFVSAGYSTWNLYFKYDLIPLFKDAYLDGDKIDMNEFALGLRFYIL